MNIKKRCKQITLGELKMWQTRLDTYISMLSFTMLFYLFAVENKWFEWYIWIFVITLTVIFIVVFDTIKVMPEQLAYGFKKNPEWQKHKRNQKREMQNQKHIMKKLDIEEFYQEYAE